MAELASFTLKKRNPDVLTCIANLSNDEVFTPPEFAKQMLDTIEMAWSAANDGASIWSDSKVTFLDPCTKSGVFLREIVERLTHGLENEIPDLQTRVDHILTKQVFGIGITHLTSLLARRSVYCSKFANGEHSVASSFDDADGNIWFESIKHTWVGGNQSVETADEQGNPIQKKINGRCKYCGASQSTLERSIESETHAYSFIHTEDVKKFIAEIYGENMQFDVIIGNPPYQLNVGNTSGNSAKASAIYHNFVSQAMNLEPRFLSMVIPSRWMTRSTEGIPESWIDSMIDDKRIRVLHDFLDSKLCFPGVEIKGGVCYFLWSRDSQGTCEYVMHKNNEPGTAISNTDYLNAKGVGIVIRDVRALSILEKIEKVEKDWLSNESKNFSGLVSPKDFFTNKVQLTSSWDGFSVKKDKEHSIKYYLNRNMHKIPFGYVARSDIPKNLESAKLHKVYIPAAGWGGAKESDDPVLGTPFYGEPNSVCSQTYLVIGHNPELHNFSKVECENIISYVSTRFFRYLVSLKKRTQNGPRGVYQFVPLQDFSRSWTDEDLYKRYRLTSEEIQFVESMIRPMELENE